MSQEQIDKENANRRLDWADKKEDANANRRQKYQSSNLQAVNEKRRLKYLQMTDVYEYSTMCARAHSSVLSRTIFSSFN